MKSNLSIHNRNFSDDLLIIRKMQQGATLFPAVIAKERAFGKMRCKFLWRMKIGILETHSNNSNFILHGSFLRFIFL